ncbi:MAG: DUF5071 domain-containing protein [Bacteroidales bacterium]|nr:DUF5071 domain-containing protein [Bacteroidales bacterium]
MKNPKDYIPTHKHDTEKIDELAKIGYPFYKPILYELFEWIQDYNWPVAQKITPILRAAGKDIIPVVKKILKTDDDIWKYWILQQVLYKMPISIVEILKPELTKISENPTAKEKHEEVDIEAKDILEKLNN